MSTEQELITARCRAGHHHFVKIQDALGSPGTPYWQCRNVECEEVRARSGRAVSTENDWLSKRLSSQGDGADLPGRPRSIRDGG